MVQGDPGDLFYIIKEGEAVVYQATPQGTRKVNHLFKADFFGERALLCDEPRYCALTLLCYIVPHTLPVYSAFMLGPGWGFYAGMWLVAKFDFTWTLFVHCPAVCHIAHELLCLFINGELGSQGCPTRSTLVPLQQGYQL